jgi:hypothetical protein
MLLNVITPYDADKAVAEAWLEELIPSTSKVNDTFKIYAVFKYVKKKKDLKAVKEDKRWDKINGPKSMTAAKKILEVFEGDVKAAAKCVMEIGEYLEKMDGPWGLWAVYRNITEWEEGRLNR